MVSTIKRIQSHFLKTNLISFFFFFFFLDQDFKSQIAKEVNSISRSNDLRRDYQHLKTAVCS